jgi:hypothetical protein
MRAPGRFRISRQCETQYGGFLMSPRTGPSHVRPLRLIAHCEFGLPTTPPVRNLRTGGENPGFSGLEVQVNAEAAMASSAPPPSAAAFPTPASVTPERSEPASLSSVRICRRGRRRQCETGDPGNTDSSGADGADGRHGIDHEHNRDGDAAVSSAVSLAGSNARIIGGQNARSRE